jgi:hypothetical protein
MRTMWVHSASTTCYIYYIKAHIINARENLLLHRIQTTEDRWIVDIRWAGRRSESLKLYAVRSDDQMHSRVSPPKHKNPS